MKGKRNGKEINQENLDLYTPLRLRLDMDRCPEYVAQETEAQLAEYVASLKEQDQMQVDVIAEKYSFQSFELSNMN